MLDPAAMRKFLAEEYGIMSDSDLDKALKKGGMNIAVFTSCKDNHEREKKSARKTA